MRILANPFYQTGIKMLDVAIPFPSVNAQRPAQLLKDCPSFKTTPLVNARALAELCEIDNLHLKDERGRFALGSFKALGASYVIANDAAATGEDNMAKALTNTTYVTASAGNHGLSVAAGAAIFGAKAVIYLSKHVPERFAVKLREKQAEVVRSGETYEESMEKAEADAQANGWRLLSDSSWPGYNDIPHCLMEGYLQILHEVEDNIETIPTHIFLQAGVGGFAGAMATYARHIWGINPKIIVVEPEAAPALFESIKAGKAIKTTGPVSTMGRLDCKEPSLIALKGLSRDASYFITLSDEECALSLSVLARAGFHTTPSGAAGFAALWLAKSDYKNLEITAQSSVLAFITEGHEG